MKTWSYGTNSHPDYQKGTIYLIERPWFVALAEWFALWIAWEWLYLVNLPSWPRVQWSGSDYPCSAREWWGDVGQLVNAYVTNPLYQWAWSHPRTVRTEIELGFARIREVFEASDPGRFKREDEMEDYRRAYEIRLAVEEEA